MTRVRAWQRLLGVLMMGLLGAAPALAQAVAGSQLSGVVRDPSGAVVPGAEVTVIKTDTGQERTARSGPDGSYAFPNLPVGPYELRVSLQGFNTYEQSGIILQVSTNPVINVTLEVGRGESMTVTADAS